MSAIHLSLIVPAYNEARSIRDTLAAFQSHLNHQPYTYEIIVSADGTDGTREIVAELARKDPRLSVIGTAIRGGKGRGIRLAVARCSGQVIGYADADNKTPIEEIGNILPWFNKGFDLVIGSRALSESTIEHPQPLYRRLGSQAFRLAMHTLTGLWSIKDTQCGFKFFRSQVAHDLFRRQRIDGYMFDVEILYLAKHSGYRIKEIGIRWRDDGDSRLRLVTGNLQNMVDLLRISWKESYTS